MNETRNSMHKELLGVHHYFGILFKEMSTKGDFRSQPRIRLVDLPVEYERVDYPEGKFNRDPKVEVSGVVGEDHLDDGLDDIHRLEIGRDYIVALVGTEKVLPVINKVAD